MLLKLPNLLKITTQILAVIGAALISILMVNKVSYAYEFDDWITSKSCNKIISPTCSNLCNGYYLEPNYPFPDSRIPLKDYPLEITSDEGKFVENGVSVFKGNVVSAQGNRLIYADTADVTHSETTGIFESLHALGHVKIIEPGSRIDGSEAYYYDKENKKIVKNAQFRFYNNHVRGTSTELKTEGKYLIYLPNATYTTCAPKTNTWELKAKKVNLDRESGRGEAWHSSLYVKNVPVFYWPYVNFPIDDRRQTGFLQPAIKHSSKLGGALIMPCYLNLAANYDATINPYLTTKRGFRLLNEFRYLTANSNGMLVFDFLPEDSAYSKFRQASLADTSVPNTSLKKSALQNSLTRYAFSAKNETKFTRDFSFDIDYTRVGDDNYIQQIGPEAIQAGAPGSASLISAVSALQQNFNAVTQADTTTALLQKMQLQYRHNIGTLGYVMQEYQTLHPFIGAETVEQYSKLPEINFQSRIFELPLGSSIVGNSSYTTFKMKSNTNSNAIRPTGDRFYLKPTLSRPISEAAWFIKPNVKLHQLNYALKADTLNRTSIPNNNIMNTMPVHASKSIPIYDVDTGLIFERDLTLKNQSYVQTLEPRAYFLHVPNQFQDNLPVFDTGATVFDYNQLFRDNRYTGFDRQSEANQVSLAISSKFLEGNSFDEKASLSVGQIRYFRSRVARLNEYVDNNSKTSPVAGLLTYKIDSSWNLESNVVWEPRKKRLNLVTAMLQYKPSAYNVFNIGYKFERLDLLNDAINPATNQMNHLRQMHLSSAWYLTERFRGIGKIEYDLQNKNAINMLAGLEYYTCCTNLRVVLMRNRLTQNPTTQNSVNQRTYDTSVALQLVFKGFAGIGGANPGLIASGIPGYSATRDNEF